jgi:ADP-heptose:LPS heptosyltransferase
MLMEKLGVEPAGKDLEFPISQADTADFIAADLQLEPVRYVCIHPGSRGVARQWNPAYFAKLADLAVEAGFQAVITGTKSELNIVEKVASEMKYEPVIAAGKTSLGAMAVLIRDAYALISNCTGVSHVAAALKTKSVVISLHGEPERWSPLNSRRHETIDWTKTPDFNLVKQITSNLLNAAKHEFN